MSNKLFLTNLPWYNLNTMASGQTPTYLLPYPLATDPVNVHGDIFDLADRLEDIIGGLSSLPAQSGNNGKFLTTDGSSASWAIVPIPAAATPTVLGTVLGRTYPENLESGLEYVNVSLGYKSLELMAGSPDATIGNVAVGSEALKSLTSGSNNVAIGHRAAYRIASGSDSIFIGTFAGDRMSGEYNIGIGTNAFDSTGPSNAPYYGNISIGDSVLFNFTQGDSNLAIGDSAGTSLEIGYNNIIIGSNAQASDLEVSHEITLGDIDIANLRIPGLDIVMGYKHGFFAPTVMENITHDDTTPLNGPLDFYLIDGNSRYYSDIATGNWQIDLTWQPGESFYNAAYVDLQDSTFASSTIVVISKQGATPYFCNGFKVDGVTQSVKWQGGTAPTSGSANSLDIYTFTVVPLDTVPNYLVLGSVTKFA